jgi:polyisoprenoid-binding protein YceI
MSRSVDISFSSATPIENIEAHNNQVSSIFDESSGEIVFQVPIRGFHFEKALMEEHFNENYMESEEFPNATLQGIITGELAKNKHTNEVEVNGVITIHGVEVERTFSGQMAYKDGSWFVQSEFSVNAEDFGIKIPRIVRKQIAENIMITVNATLNPRQ